MGINRDNDNGQDQARDAFREAGLGGQAKQPEQVQDEAVHLASRRYENTGPIGPQTVNSRFFRSVPRAQASQTVTEAKKAFTEALNEFQIKSVDQGISYLFDTIDNTTPGVKMGALLNLAHFEAKGGQKVMLAYVLMLDGSLSSLGVAEVKPISMPALGRLEADRQALVRQLTALDYTGDSFRNAIVDKLKRTYGSDYEVIIIGNCTLPRKFDFSKEGGQVHAMLVNSIGALETYIGAVFGDERPLTIRDVAHNAQTTITMEHNTTVGQTANGLPLRRDVTLTLRSTQRSSNIGEPDDVVEVVQVQGYIDLLYTEPTQPLSSNQRPQTQRFTPIYMLTNMTSVDWNLITPETQLLSLGLAPIMSFNEQFLAPLMSRVTSSDKDHDAGALGYVVNYSGEENGQPVGKEDTSKLSTKEQLDMLRMAIFNELHVALVIDTSGPLAWMNSMFVDAATGNVKAEDAIIQAADNLTGDVFGKAWAQRASKEPMFRLIGGKHVGYYEAKNGELRSLDDFDTLWALNVFGEQNIDRAWDFMETYLDTADLAVQMAKRWKYVTQVYPGATLVSEAAIVEPSADFLEVLMDSIVAAGLPLKATTYLQDFSGTRGRVSFHGGRGLDSSSVASTLSRGFGVTERRSTAGFSQTGFNRWTGSRG